MRDLMAELKELRLHGMANAWADLTAQGESALASSKWLLEHLLQQEHADRAMRSVNHQRHRFCIVSLWRQAPSTSSSVCASIRP
ncbi:hypothetical protein SAMN05216190_1912 [Pseudomonas borbori]|uniref:IstB-like ATP-binding domain-containing protein n=1 Tax=Pseudomonas borbori TaxID=289003 RepID=A0A1I5XX59_9PSED|nr:hypothetical protein SAMN05216190_1912 [Pseudomonas borbori]